MKKTADGAAVGYWADDIYVEGNRDTTQEVRVSKLFETPAKPTKAGVYWSWKDSGETREGFLGYLTWDGMPFNAVGVDVQIANITKWYKNDGQDKTTFNAGDDVIADASDLWQKIDNLVLGGGNPAFSDVVTELKWSDVPQNAKKFPAIWKEGSLLNGAPGVVFLMQTGQVYTVRIRAAGATDNSDWLIVDSTSSQALTKPKMLANAADNTGTDDAKDFNAVKLQKGIFDLVMLKYDLQGKYELAKTDAGGTKGVKATASELVVFKSYGDAITIDMKYTNMATPQQDDWFLYPLGSGDIGLRSKGWKGWKGVEDANQSFVFNTWGSYSGHTDLTLIALGAGVNGNMQAETPGTFNVLTAANVLVDIVDTQGGQLTLDELNAGTHATGDVKTTGTGLAEDAGNSRYILSLDNAAKAGTGGTATWLYVSVGKDPATPGILDDKNGNEFTVQDIEVEIIQNGVTKIKTFTKDSQQQAHANLDGMASGTYTLKVKILPSTGYQESYNVTLVIKYNNQTA